MNSNTILWLRCCHEPKLEQTQQGPNGTDLRYCGNQIVRLNQQIPSWSRRNAKRILYILLQNALHDAKSPVSAFCALLSLDWLLELLLESRWHYDCESNKNFILINLDLCRTISVFDGSHLSFMQNNLEIWWKSLRIFYFCLSHLLQVSILLFGSFFCWD